MAPASRARLITVSGSSQNNSTLTLVVPISIGLFQPFLAGSARKKGAPSISKPATDPRLHNTVAPSACLYHSTAAGASGTASMREITGVCNCDFTTVLSGLAYTVEAKCSRAEQALFSAANPTSRVRALLGCFRHSSSLPAMYRSFNLIPFCPITVFTKQFNISLCVSTAFRNWHNVIVL